MVLIKTDGTVDEDEMEVDLVATHRLQEEVQADVQQMDLELSDTGGSSTPRPAADAVETDSSVKTDSSKPSQVSAPEGRRSRIGRPIRSQTAPNPAASKNKVLIEQNRLANGHTTPPASPAPPSPGSVPRSKAQKNLALFEAAQGAAGSETSAPGSAGSDRYNLRTASRSASGNALSTITDASSTAARIPPATQPAQSNASPSRLPQRVTAKKRGNPRPQNAQHDVFLANTASAPASGKMTTRSVRKCVAVKAVA